MVKLVDKIIDYIVDRVTTRLSETKAKPTVVRFDGPLVNYDPEGQAAKVLEILDYQERGRTNDK